MEGVTDTAVPAVDDDRGALVTISAVLVVLQLSLLHARAAREVEPDEAGAALTPTRIIQSPSSDREYEDSKTETTGNEVLAVDTTVLAS